MKSMEHRALEYAFLREVDRIFQTLCRDIDTESLNSIRDKSNSTAMTAFSKSYRTAKMAFDEACVIIET